MADDNMIKEELPEKIPAEQLDQVAGGQFWPDEAPDGHDMGCSIPWHHYDWSEENDIWCPNSYFCKESFHSDPYKSDDSYYG